MKNLGYILILSLFLFLAYSCGGGSREASVPSFKETLTKEDTVAVLQRCDSCMQALKAGEIDMALGMLSLLQDDGKVTPLTKSKTDQLKRMFKLFPVLAYQIDSYTFYSYEVNEVKYTIEFFEKKAGDPTPNTIGFMFNPIKCKDGWRLAVKDAGQKLLDKSTD